VAVKLIREVEQVHWRAVVDVSGQKSKAGARLLMLLDANIFFVRSQTVILRRVLDVINEMLFRTALAHHCKFQFVPNEIVEFPCIKVHGCELQPDKE